MFCTAGEVWLGRLEQAVEEGGGIDLLYDYYTHLASTSAMPQAWVVVSFGWVDCPRQRPVQTTSAKSPPLLSLSPLLLHCPRQTSCEQHPSLLRCSTCPAAIPAPRTLSKDHSSRRSSVFRGTPQNVGWQGQREAASRYRSRRRAAAAAGASPHTQEGNTPLFYDDKGGAQTC
jgi:hypothetical protein